MSARDSDVSSGTRAQARVVTPPSASAPPTDSNPLDDRPGTTGNEPNSVIIPPPGPDRWRAAVVVPPPAVDGNRPVHQEHSPFSRRKVVPATSPGDLSAPGGDASAGQPAPPSLATAVPTASREATEGDTGLESTSDRTWSDTRRAAINTGLRWTMVARPFIETANLLGVAVLARLVTPADFGRWAIAMIVLTLATVPTQAVQYSIVQRDQIDRDHLHTGVTLTILMGLGVCALCFVASYTVVPNLFDARTAMLVRLTIPSSFINSVNTVQIATLTRRLEFRRLSLLDMMITVGGTALAIPLAAIGLGGEAMVLALLAASTVGFILLCCWIRPPVPGFRLSSARDLLRAGIPAASSAASLVGFQNCDYVIVGARLGALQAGYYFRAYTLGVVYQKKVSQVMYSLGFPVMSRSTSDAEIHHLRQRMLHTVTLTLFPLLTALAIVAPKFVPWFYGPEWHAAIVPVQLLTIGGAAMLVAEAVIVSMLATGRARAVAWWGWGHFLAYGAGVFAVAHFGLPAVAAAAVLIHTTFLIVAYLQLHHGCLRRAFNALAKDVFPAVACSVGFAAVALPVSVAASRLGIPTLPYLITTSLAGGAGYVLSLRLWFPSELRHLRHLVRRLLPGRTQRLLGRLVSRPQPQSAA